MCPVNWWVKDGSQGAYINFTLPLDAIPRHQKDWSKITTSSFIITNQNFLITFKYMRCQSDTGRLKVAPLCPSPKVTKESVTQTVSQHITMHRSKVLKRQFKQAMASSFWGRLESCYHVILMFLIRVLAWNLLFVVNRQGWSNFTPWKVRQISVLNQRAKSTGGCISKTERELFSSMHSYDLGPN